MLQAFLWGALATSSLLLGGLLATGVSLSRRSLGLLMAFGAGTLISAVSFELVFEALRRSRGSGYPAIGFFAGALCFYICDGLIETMGQRRQGARGSRGGEADGVVTQKADPRSAAAGLAVPMVLGIILDGIPESVVIGLGILERNAVSLAMLVAIFLSNLPEAVAGTIGMGASGWSRSQILSLWLLIAVACAGASAAGYVLFQGAPKEWLSLIQAFAGGAILMMLSDSMIPEAYARGGRLTGLLTVTGFSISVGIILLETAH